MKTLRVSGVFWFALALVLAGCHSINFSTEKRSHRLFALFGGIIFLNDDVTLDTTTPDVGRILHLARKMKVAKWYGEGAGSSVWYYVRFFTMGNNGERFYQETIILSAEFDPLNVTGPARDVAELKRLILNRFLLINEPAVRKANALLQIKQS